MMMPPKPGGFRHIKGLMPAKGDGGKKKGEMKKMKRHMAGKEKGSVAMAKGPDSNIADYAGINKGKLEYLTAKYAEGYERALGSQGGISHRVKSLFKGKSQKKLNTFLKK
jgi:hypothetical protein